MAGAALTIGEVLEFLIRKGPGRTERELAEAIFGPGAKQQSVNQDVRLLVGRGAPWSAAARAFRPILIGVILSISDRLHPFPSYGVGVEEEKGR